MASDSARSTFVGRALPSAWLVVLGAAACVRGEPETYRPEYREASTSTVTEVTYTFAVHPLHNPERLFAIYGPIVEHLDRHVPGARFRLEASRSYGEFEARLLTRRSVHFALPNPYQTARASSRGYRVFGKMGDDEAFRGIIVVRKDSEIHELRDLKGKAVSYPAPTALAATMMPQFLLHQHGLEVERDVRSVYVGSQESAIMSVYGGFSAAGATWPVPWRTFQREHPAEAAALEVRWETESLPNNGLVVRDDVPAEIARGVAEALFTLHESDEGRRLLERVPISRFEPATDATYDVVRQWVLRFSHEVRPVEE